MPPHDAVLFGSVSGEPGHICRHDPHDCPGNNGRPVTWSSAVAPGGWVCAVPDLQRPDGVCGMPVESEPCGRDHGHETSSEET